MRAVQAGVLQQQHRKQQESPKTNCSLIDIYLDPKTTQTKNHFVGLAFQHQPHFQTKEPTMPDIPSTLPFDLSFSTAYLTPTFSLILFTLTTLYFLTLSPLLTTPSFSLDYLLHLSRILFPPLSQVYSLCTGYILCHLVVSSAIPMAPILVAAWYTILCATTALNTRLGHGKAKKVVWSRQIAVVTGGAGGLGWLIAKILQLKGVEVIVWDIRAPEEWNEDEEDAQGIKWYKVDVGNAEEVESAYRKVCNDVRSALFLFPCFRSQFHLLSSPFHQRLRRQITFNTVFVAYSRILI